MKNFESLREQNYFYESNSLHGKTISHGTTNHTITIKKVSENHYDFYRKNKYVGTITADNENAARRILMKKGYSFK
jgi:hypothetical protein